MCKFCNAPTHAYETLAALPTPDLSGMCEAALNRFEDALMEQRAEERAVTGDHFMRLTRAMREEEAAWRMIEQRVEARCPKKTPKDEDREGVHWWGLANELDHSLYTALEADEDERPGEECTEYGVLQGVLAILDEPTLDVEALVPKSAAEARAWYEDEPLDPVEAYAAATDGEYWI